ncbi:isocitrate lyase/phosphoenolpyruvate mutase family protein [Streptomyces sp. NPDC021356]|uniref:isocitrate lyase/PEP mutase family protein n=1 Tax=Streptomyces sp. NPDC021356 TaxID=3154900 RepID=UPI0034032434
MSSFHELHRAGEVPFLLPNAWDVGSALAFVEAGFPALGTTSFGIAAAAGSPDGRHATREATRDLVARLRALPVHVSADIEDGYAEDPEQVAAYAAGLGAAGVNIEDSTADRLVPADVLAAKVAAVKRRAPGLFVNARVDTYWVGEDATVEATLARARAYVAAGADGIFVPGATDPGDVRAFTSQLPVPVNVLAVPGVPLEELGRLGVRRVSTGSLPYRAAVEAAVAVAEAVRDGEQVPAATPYRDAQRRLLAYEARLGGAGTAPPAGPVA